MRAICTSLLVVAPLFVFACGASSQDGAPPQTQPTAPVAAASPTAAAASRVHCELLPPIKPSPYGTAAGVRAQAQAQFDSGMKELDAQHYDAAMSALGKAYETLPHPDVLFDLAVAQCKGGKSDEARASLQQYGSMNPPDKAAVDKAIN